MQRDRLIMQRSVVLRFLHCQHRTEMRTGLHGTGKTLCFQFYWLLLLLRSICTLPGKRHSVQQYFKSRPGTCSFLFYAFRLKVSFSLLRLARNVYYIGMSSTASLAMTRLRKNESLRHTRNEQLQKSNHSISLAMSNSEKSNHPSVSQYPLRRVESLFQPRRVFVIATPSKIESLLL